jgi:uncharacterized protein with WD repeat
MVQKLELSKEQKKEANRETCLDENKLRMALAKCPPDVKKSDCADLSALSKGGHKLRGSKPEDFLPTGKLCKVKGALLLESEREQYEKIYCKVDPAHKICKKEETKKEETKQEVVEETKKSDSSAAGIVVLSSSSCSCLVLMAGAMMMMRR